MQIMEITGGVITVMCCLVIQFINTARWQKMEGLLMKARSHTALWEIKYYFVTMMFSKSILVLNGLMQNKQCKDIPSSSKKV
jgi:hypothetical protein